MESPLTLKQRLIVYKVAKLHFTGIASGIGLCWSIAEVTRELCKYENWPSISDVYPYTEMETAYPEIYQYCPKEFRGESAYWFHPDNREARLDILDKAIAEVEAKLKEGICATVGIPEKAEENEESKTIANNKN